MSRSRIDRIAKNVRAWADELAEQCYPGVSRDLETLCAVASGELLKRLRRANFKPVIVFNDQHAFVVCNGHIVDVTATQYNYRRGRDGEPLFEPVVIVPYSRRKELEQWSLPVEFRAKTIREALKFQREVGWPEDQWVLTKRPPPSDFNLDDL